MILKFLTVPLFLISFAVVGQDIVLNLSGLRIETKSNGYNAKEADYFDDKGNVVFTITYDNIGNLEDTPFGVAIIERKFDERKNLIERKFYDQNRKLFRTEIIGPAIEKFKYDKKNNLIEIIYCDQKGEPLDNGLAIVTAKHDKNGNLIEERQLDNKRQMIDGISILKYQYDSKNRKTEASRFDRNEKLIKVKGTEGYAIVRYKYDQQDRVIEESFYDENNELIDGIAMTKFNYDKKPEKNSSVFDNQDPQWVEQIYLDKAGNELSRDFRYLPKKKN